MIEKIFTKEWLLECPYCNETYLHHGPVEVFQRAEEDSPSGLHCVIFRSAMMHVDNDVSAGNPSNRRSGMIIRFWCEMCRKCSWLHILQHKGQTFMRWQINPCAEREELDESSEV